MVQAPVVITNAQLAAELDALSVYFLRSDAPAATPYQLMPSLLMTALAASDEARVRLALIPLLLRHPTFARDALFACQALAATNQIVFKCYYTAARLLQQKYQARLALFTEDSALLPDLYGAELGILPTNDPDQSLQQLAEQHAMLSGKPLNWLGTYEHAAQRWLTHMELRRAWVLSLLPAAANGQPLPLDDVATTQRALQRFTRYHIMAQVGESYQVEIPLVAQWVRERARLDAEV